MTTGNCWRRRAAFAHYCRQACLLAIMGALAACGSVPATGTVPLSTAETMLDATTPPAPTFGMAPTEPVTGSTASRRPLLGELFSIQGGTTMFVDVLEPLADGTTTPLQLRFDALLKDDRCPRLVACVVRGDAVIAIVAQLGAANQPETLQLHTDPARKQGSASYQGYDISLEKLAPTLDRPGDTLALSGYMATLRVTSLTHVLPTATPAPSAAPTPLKVSDACVLTDSTTISALFGAIESAPVASTLAAYSGQQCVIQADARA